MKITPLPRFVSKPTSIEENISPFFSLADNSKRDSYFTEKGKKFTAFKATELSRWSIFTRLIGHNNSFLVGYLTIILRGRAGYQMLLFNKLSLCPYMVRKPSISVIRTWQISCDIRKWPYLEVHCRFSFIACLAAILKSEAVLAVFSVNFNSLEETFHD